MNNDLENAFLNFYNKIKCYKNLGTKETKYANLIGSVPHIGKEAWLHAIFKPISKNEIKEMNNKLRVEIPKIYEDFLLMSNGFSIFGTTLSLFGYRFNYIRDLENLWQPFNLVELNNNDRPNDSPDNFFFIGSYDWDGSYLYINMDNLNVIRCYRETSRAINKWNSLEVFLEEEITRISKLFDEKGKEFDEFKQTVP